MAPRRSRSAAAAKPKAKDAAAVVSLKSLLLTHFNAYQEGSSGDLEMARKSVRSAVEELSLAKAVASMNMGKEAKNESPTNDDDLSTVLTYILDCAIANATLDASKRIVELVAAVIVDATTTATIGAENRSSNDGEEEKEEDHHSNDLDFDDLLDRLIQFSKCTTESVRALSTFMLTQWFNFCLEVPAAAKDHDRLTALQQAILPRFTDKAVSVRAETLKISSVAMTSDPDLLTAGCFSLQHDPSSNNRKLAAEQIPVTLQTAEYFVYRIRDVKNTVRTAALAALERAAIRGDDLVLDAAQLAEIVLTGCTDRYVRTKHCTIFVVVFS
jgi:hypothetical protein